MDEFPLVFPAAQKVVQNIDVMWFTRYDVPVHAFEVESTTSIYSGLLRMSDLAYVRGKLPLYIVAPASRHKKLLVEIERPTFREAGLREKVQFISFERLREFAAQHRGDFDGLRPEAALKQLVKK